jgi:hypothetical protein
MLDEEREVKRVQIEESIFHCFMAQVKNLPEDEWRYFALACAERMITGVMLSKRQDMVIHEHERYQMANAARSISHAEVSKLRIVLSD